MDFPLFNNWQFGMNQGFFPNLGINLSSTFGFPGFSGMNLWGTSIYNPSTIEFYADSSYNTCYTPSAHTFTPWPGFNNILDPTNYNCYYGKTSAGLNLSTYQTPFITNYAPVSATPTPSKTLDEKIEAQRTKNEENKIKKERENQFNCYKTLLQEYQKTLSEEDSEIALILQTCTSATEETLDKLKETYKEIKNKIETEIKSGNYSANMLAAYYNAKELEKENGKTKIDQSKANADAKKLDAVTADTEKVYSKYEPQIKAANSLIATVANMTPPPEIKTAISKNGNKYQSIKLDNGQLIDVYFDNKGEIAKINISTGTKPDSSKNCIEVSYTPTKLVANSSLDKTGSYECTINADDNEKYDFDEIKKVIEKVFKLDKDYKTDIKSIAFGEFNESHHYTKANYELVDMVRAYESDKSKVSISSSPNGSKLKIATMGDNMVQVLYTDNGEKIKEITILNSKTKTEVHYLKDKRQYKENGKLKPFTTDNGYNFDNIAKLAARMFGEKWTSS